MNIALVEERLKVAFVTAAKLMDGLVELGIVEELTGARRNRVYRYSPYLALFADQPPKIEAADVEVTERGQQRLPIA